MGVGGKCRKVFHFFVGGCLPDCGNTSTGLCGLLIFLFSTISFFFHICFLSYIGRVGQGVGVGSYCYIVLFYATTYPNAAVSRRKWAGTLAIGHFSLCLCCHFRRHGRRKEAVRLAAGVCDSTCELLAAVSGVS